MKAVFLRHSLCVKKIATHWKQEKLQKMIYPQIQSILTGWCSGSVITGRRWRCGGAGILSVTELTENLGRRGLQLLNLSFSRIHSLRHLAFQQSNSVCERWIAQVAIFVKITAGVKSQYLLRLIVILVFLLWM